jgi:hypothetical protein
LCNSFELVQLGRWGGYARYGPLGVGSSHVEGCGWLDLWLRLGSPKDVVQVI